MDQAETLRALMSNENQEQDLAQMAKAGIRIIHLVSAVKGLGKSTACIQLARILAEAQQEVLLLDGDCSDQQLEDWLNVRPNTSFSMLLEGNSTVDESIITLSPHLHLLPATAGLLEMVSADQSTRDRLVDLLEYFPRPIESIILDGQTSMLHKHFQNVWLITPDEAVVRATAQAIVNGRQLRGVSQADVIVNQVTDGRHGQEIFKSLDYQISILAGTSRIQLNYLGHLPVDEKLNRCMNQKNNLLELYPRAASIACFRLLTKRLAQSYSVAEQDQPFSTLKDEPMSRLPRKLTGFWKTLLGEVRT